MGSHRNRARKRQGAAKLKDLEQHLSMLLEEHHSNHYSLVLKEEILETRQGIEQLRALLERKGTFVPPAGIKPPERKAVIYKSKPHIVPKWEKPGPVTIYFDKELQN
jgi:hypothetical protein